MQVEFFKYPSGLSYDVGSEYLDLYSDFLKEERDVHQDCIKNFCTLFRAFVSEQKMPILSYVILQRQGALIFRLLPHLSNMRFELLLRSFLKDIQVKEPEYQYSEVEDAIGFGVNLHSEAEERKIP